MAFIIIKTYPDNLSKERLHFMSFRHALGCDMQDLRKLATRNGFLSYHRLGLSPPPGVTERPIAGRGGWLFAVGYTSKRRDGVGRDTSTLFRFLVKPKGD